MALIWRREDTNCIGRYLTDIVKCLVDATVVNLTILQYSRTKALHSGVDRLSICTYAERILRDPRG